MFRHLALFVFACIPLSLQAAVLDIQLNDIKNSNGTVTLSLFDNASAFEQQVFPDAESSIVQKSKSGTMKFRFSNLRPGRYALMVHHDENKDGVLNMQGANPREGYAFSKGAGRKNIPNFSQASIEIKEGSNSESLSMIYLAK
ncbi:DUF2141 domain-containing protein [Sansalvadorimonas sp. 2012CJ34-2]|uniref:DUF2141 domain-containing protein n=1 Tax=Parendozoicomonas callyspongiae TaxID=2942213 RepID=A0ABT0PBB8_9GAMM|nr:DUF2141 domain-containing protein [Sansalvadorimonas sp. 2012CJ34-2]MCL6268615.1 DUF2141 domain-containing protein [Sansalvadorimonas sp. 2012CJ34-2]